MRALCKFLIFWQNKLDSSSFVISHTQRVCFCIHIDLIWGTSASLSHNTNRVYMSIHVCNIISMLQGSYVYNALLIPSRTSYQCTDLALVFHCAGVCNVTFIWFADLDKSIHLSTISNCVDRAWSPFACRSYSRTPKLVSPICTQNLYAMREHTNQTPHDLYCALASFSYVMLLWSSQAPECRVLPAQTQAHIKHDYSSGCVAATKTHQHYRSTRRFFNCT